MATDIDIIVSRTPTKTIQDKADPISQTNIVQTADFQGTTQCNVACPFCTQELSRGACVLQAGHIELHQCNRVSTHQWSAAGIPGPHGEAASGSLVSQDAIRLDFEIDGGPLPHC